MDSDEEVAATLAGMAMEKMHRSMTVKDLVEEEVKALNEIRGRALEELSIIKALAPSPLTRTKTIRPVAPNNVPFVAIKPSDYLTPRYKGRAKKKKKLEPPPAPRIRPVPRDLSAVEVMDINASDAKIVLDLTGGYDTPGRVTKVADDVIVEMDGIKLSMNEMFDASCGVLGTPS